MFVVLCNCPPDKAHEIATAVVDAGLAACVNLVENVTSVFAWEGKRDEVRETTLIIKTPDGNVGALRNMLVAVHPYEVPEILVIPVDAGRSHPAYVDWVESFALPTPRPGGPMTLFERIIAREIPAKIAYEDEHVLAFHDVVPQAPIHVLVVPKKPIPRLSASTDDDALLLGRLLCAARKVTKQQGIATSGYRVVINNGSDGGQSVEHLHLHVLGGRQLEWPPG